MTVHPTYARTLVGQWVECRSHYGIHRGILHTVRRDGIVLAVPRGGMVRPIQGHKEHAFSHADRPECQNAEPVYWLWPLFFIPWALLFALAPFFWW